NTREQGAAVRSEQQRAYAVIFRKFEGSHHRAFFQVPEAEEAIVRPNQRVTTFLSPGRHQPFSVRRDNHPGDDIPFQKSERTLLLGRRQIEDAKRMRVVPDQDRFVVWRESQGRVGAALRLSMMLKGAIGGIPK